MSYVLGVFAAEKEKEKQREALRDNFAGLAMQGLISIGNLGDSDADIANTAYKIADAMLKEREKKND